MLRGPGFVGCGRAGDVHRVAHPHGAREARQALPRSVAGDQLSRHPPSSKSSYTRRRQATGIVAEDDVRPLAAVAGQGTSAADKRDGRDTLMRSAVGA